MRFLRQHAPKSEPVALLMSYADAGALLGLLDVAADCGLDHTGLAARVGFAYDASEFGPRLPVELTPRGEALLHEQLGGDPAAAATEGAAGFTPRGRSKATEALGAKPHGANALGTLDVHSSVSTWSDYAR